MARFYGVVQGTRGQASRCGSKSSGLTTTAASWQGAVETTLYREGDIDMARVVLKPWRGVGVSRTLYEGPVGEAPQVKALPKGGRSGWDVLNEKAEG